MRPPSQTTTPVGPLHRRQPVGDHNHRAALHQALERSLHRRLRARVEVRRRLVEHEHRRIDERGPGQRDELPLTR